MNGEILSIETTENIERLKRDKNLLVLENTNLKKKIDKLEQQNSFLIQGERILQTVEMYLLQRIEKLKENNVNYLIIRELEQLSKALEEERRYVNNDK